LKRKAKNSQPTHVVNLIKELHTMAITIYKEVNRSIGAPVLSGTISGGTVLAWDPANTGKVLPFGTGTPTPQLPYGLATESNVIPPLQPASGLVAGQGFDYTNFNRDGLMGAFINGGEFQLYDDGLGAGKPFEAGTYAIGHLVYADYSATGAANITVTAGSNPAIGVVTFFDQAVNPNVLRITLDI
jgi:hypothetical protein